MKTALITAEDCDLHDTGRHIEAVARRSAVLAHLDARGVLGERLVTALAATDSDLARVHTERYITAIGDLALRGGGWIDADTIVSPGSDQGARAAAGAAIRALDEALGASHRAIAIARPPGHHALANRGMGFCLYNSVAVAAAAALTRPTVERVLIVDWDVHHGNGTQAIFAADPRVCFVSTHQWPHYPGTGAIDELVDGEGRGSTVNIPLPAGVGDDGYLGVFLEVVAPVARRFRPNVILVSAGYDAHRDDPLGDMRVTAAGFGALTRQVVGLADELCDGRVAFVLEGGYNLQALATSVEATLRACDDPESVVPMASPGADVDLVAATIERVRRLHQLSD